MHKRFHKPFIVLFLTILILFIMSLLKLEGKIGFIHMRKVDLFSDINKGDIEEARTQPKSPAGAVSANKECAGREIRVSATKIVARNEHPHTEGSGPLDNFFQALLETEKNGQPVRIAYFGDSIVEGDLITGDLRRILQARFGGTGVGFVPITSVASRTRNTIDHTFSDNWQIESLHPKPTEVTNLGISGFACLPKKDRSVTNLPRDDHKSYTYAWAEYGASKLFDNTKQFSTVRLFYGTVKDFAFIKVKIDDRPDRIVGLEQGDSLRVMQLTNGEAVKKVRVQFYANDTAVIYGLSFDDSRGAFVDNYSIRGYSGVTLNRIPCTTFSAFNSQLNYKLIILHYGLNVASFANRKQLNWYQNQMMAVVNHLKSCMPDSSILIVSVNDMASRQGSGMATKDTIPALVEAQKEVAEKTGVAFWNLFEAMGGENSMVAWVHDKKPLATKDYTHFNHRGARKVAELLSKSLLAEYERYTLKRTAPENGRGADGPHEK